MTTLEADYIIIGSGPAGCALAYQLATKYNVILLEAGPMLSSALPITNIHYAGFSPSLLAKYNPYFFYSHKSVPDGSIASHTDSKKGITIGCHTTDSYFPPPTRTQPTKVTTYTTGRLLGGGSSINGLQYVRGTAGVFNQWATIDSRWAYPKVLAAYRELENVALITRKCPDDTMCSIGEETKHRGHDGRISITPMVTSRNLFSALSIAEIEDYNNPDTPYGYFRRWDLYLLPSGERCSADKAIPSRNRRGGNTQYRGYQCPVYRYQSDIGDSIARGAGSGNQGEEGSYPLCRYLLM